MTVLEEARKSAGYYLSVVRFRSLPDPLTSFTRAISSSKSVMIVLPFGDSDHSLFANVILLLKKSFKGGNITVVAADHAVETMRSLPRSQFIHVRPDELNYFFLPGRGLLERIAARPPDLAIDLNLDFLLPSAYICKASGARIRFGFTRKHSDLFFNFQVRPDRTLGRKIIYDRLANFLQKF